jgi:hypothetical protein
VIAGAWLRAPDGTMLHVIEHDSSDERSEPLKSQATEIDGADDQRPWTIRRGKHLAFSVAVNKMK